jgi:hypothetical protein
MWHRETASCAFVAEHSEWMGARLKVEMHVAIVRSA